VEKIVKDEQTPGKGDSLDLSVVIPLYNEVDSVEELTGRLSDVLKTTGRSYEIIFIDDGSEDGTGEALRRIHREVPGVVVVRFRKNFGQTAALSAGFHRSRGRVIVTMDGDLQNDPLDIPLLINKLEEGYDIVSGWRKDRQDPFLTRRVPSMVANRLISLLTGVKLHDYGCTLKAFRSEVAKSLKLYGEMHRFIPAIASWMGVSVAEVVVRHHPRKAGRSKYGLYRTVKVLLDLITVKFLLNYSTEPIQIFGLIGLLSTLTGLGLAVYLSFQKIFLKVALSNRPMLLLSVLLIFIGIQFITMGLLGELQTRAYHESQDKPVYVIKEVLE
jgi:glycosyltransferase involved in cell wall biosynthesis